MANTNGQIWITTALVAVAITVAAVAIRRIDRPLARAPSFPVLRPISPPENIAQHGNLVGVPEAETIITMFSDYQCPFCARASATLDSLVNAGNGRISIRYLHYPLTHSPYAGDAAVAAECAADQGSFMQYHRVLLQNQDSIGITSWSSFARRAHVPDLGRFRICLAEPGPLARVKADANLGSSLAIEGTPTYVVRDHQFTGTWSLAQWQEILRALGHR